MPLRSDCCLFVGELCIGRGGLGPCQHACVDNTCQCPTGYRIASDGMTCVGKTSWGKGTMRKSHCE